ncbi:hypothetical protein RHGRI_026841 [Rhododendron griersonianum]|uniref:Uncharacterized protein n=1 Tax=Rhododendron griersonianum TaxID=479676 RepID=A0AAV6IUT4_9ERIC|nr:hypothetical protein RHGRI_026841 [Rhododendron griersonianum]
MLGAGLQFGRSRGDDRFYNPPKGRRNNQNKQGQDPLRRAQSDVTVVSHTKGNSVKREQETRGGGAVETPKPVAEPALEQVSSPLCNLERFLESVTPSVPAQHPSKTSMRGWRTCDEELQPYFVLGDLWESFKEWSAYGAGVPLILNDSDSVVQYYVPFLSAIQIYVDPSKSSVKSRRPGEDSDGDYFRDSSSDGSSDSEQERCLNLREQHNHHRQMSEIPRRLDGLSLREHATIQEGFSSDEGESGNAQGCLMFEYLERDQPYGRVPLADKASFFIRNSIHAVPILISLFNSFLYFVQQILDLALRFPKLKTLRSCDLLSCSWISVAWYPIYRIPVGPTLEDLNACFLTFHSLNTPASGSQHARAPIVTHPSEMDGVPKISLPVFGLASYKFKASWWTPNGGSERHLLNSLLQAADKWLTMLQVNHPDFLFFCRR